MQCLECAELKSRADRALQNYSRIATSLMEDDLEPARRAVLWNELASYWNESNAATLALREHQAAEHYKPALAPCGSAACQRRNAIVEEMNAAIARHDRLIGVLHRHAGIDPPETYAVLRLQVAKVRDELRALHESLVLHDRYHPCHSERAN